MSNDMLCTNKTYLSGACNFFLKNVPICLEVRNTMRITNTFHMKLLELSRVKVKVNFCFENKLSKSKVGLSA